MGGYIRQYSFGLVSPTEKSTGQIKGQKKADRIKAVRSREF